MSDTTVTKHCNKCKTSKSLADFWKTSNAKSDGYNSWCKTCNKAYAQSPKGKSVQRKFWASAKGKRLRRKFNETLHAKAYFREYRREWRLLHPEQKKAHNAISSAVRRNILLAASEQHCWECGAQANGYHHFLGYAVEHWLDVFPLCFTCDWRAHNVTSSANT